MKQKPRGKPFAKGYDPRRRVGFTREECQRGFRAFVEGKGRCADAGVFSWVSVRILGYYRGRRQEHAEGKHCGRRQAKGGAA